MFALQRELTEWGFSMRLLEVPMPNDAREGLVNVLDNRFAEHQAEGHASKQHNSLSKKEVKIFLQAD